MKKKPRGGAKRTTPARPRAAAPKFSRSEYVRVVPLHYPKPSVSIDEMGRLRAEPPGTRAGTGPDAPRSDGLEQDGGISPRAGSRNSALQGR